MQLYTTFAGGLVTTSLVIRNLTPFTRRSYNVDEHQILALLRA